LVRLCRRAAPAPARLCLLLACARRRCRKLSSSSINCKKVLAPGANWAQQVGGGQIVRGRGCARVYSGDLIQPLHRWFGWVHLHLRAADRMQDSRNRPGGLGKPRPPKWWMVSAALSKFNVHGFAAPRNRQSTIARQGSMSAFGTFFRGSPAHQLCRNGRAQVPAPWALTWLFCSREYGVCFLSCTGDIGESAA